MPGEQPAIAPIVEFGALDVVVALRSVATPSAAATLDSNAGKLPRSAPSSIDAARVAARISPISRRASAAASSLAYGTPRAIRASAKPITPMPTLRVRRVASAICASG